MCIYIYIYMVFTYVYMYICIYINMYTVYIYAYMYMHICIWTLKKLLYPDFGPYVGTVMVLGAFELVVDASYIHC